MKILVICPSKNRPYIFKKMLDSFNITKSKQTDIVLANSCGDDCEKYLDIIYHERIFHKVFLDKVNLTQIFNECFISFPDYDFYFMANDDIIFNTPLWDLQLANKGKISWGYDGRQESLTFPMIDGDIVRALGWLQLPTLNRYAGDVVWSFIGRQCGILNYCPEVIIKHNWEGCSHPDINIKDMEEFSKWLPWSFREIKKIEDATILLKKMCDTKCGEHSI